MNLKDLWRIVFVVTLVAVTRMTLTTNPDDTKAGLRFAQLIAEALFNNPAMSDKVAHFVSYFALGSAAMLADLRISGRRVLTMAVIALYGGLLELMQGMGGVRTPDIADAFVNASGAFSALAGGLLTERMMRKSRLA